MARWQITIFDSSTDELTGSVFVEGMTLSDARRIWGLPASEPIGELPITAENIELVNEVVTPHFELQTGRESFLGLTREYSGESVREVDGTEWWPAPAGSFASNGLDLQQLLASRGEARQCLVGGCLFVVGALTFLLGALFGLTALAVTGLGAGAIGVLFMSVLDHQVSRRLRPRPMGAFERWSFESRLGQQWLRPSVIRRAITLAR